MDAGVAYERSADLRALLVAQRHGARPVSTTEVFFIAVTYAAWAFSTHISNITGTRRDKKSSEMPLAVPPSHQAALRVVERLQATLQAQAASGQGGGLTARQRATVRATRVPPPRVSELLFRAAEEVVAPPAVQSAAAYAGSTGLHTTFLASQLRGVHTADVRQNTLSLHSGSPRSIPALLQCIVRSTNAVTAAASAATQLQLQAQLQAMGASTSKAAPTVAAAALGHSAHQLASLGQHGACVGLLELVVRCVLAGQSHAEGVLAGTSTPSELPVVQAVSRWGAGEEAPPAPPSGGGSTAQMSASMANVLQVMGDAATKNTHRHMEHSDLGLEEGIDFTWADAEALADAELSLVGSVGLMEEGGDGDEGGLHHQASFGSVYSAGLDAGAGSGLVGALSLLRRQRSQRQAQADAAAAERVALLRRSAQAKLASAALAEGMPLPSERPVPSPRSVGGGHSPRWGGASSPLSSRGGSPRWGTSAQSHRGAGAGYTVSSLRRTGGDAAGGRGIQVDTADTGTFMTRLQ